MVRLRACRALIIRPALPRRPDGSVVLENPALRSVSVILFPIGRGETAITTSRDDGRIRVGQGDPSPRPSDPVRRRGRPSE